MKLFNRLLVVLIFCSFYNGQSATVNGRFIVQSITSTKYTVLLQINTNTGTDDLGGATILFNFDTTSVFISQSPVKNVDYVYHNFCGGNYSSATITRPMRNTVWVNIDLPFNNNNNGTVVAASPNWTDVVSIIFDILDPNGTISLSWLRTSPFWGIYDADNSTLWQTGTFTNLNGPLPVELVSFNATLFPDQNVLLEWVTASSLNNSGFEIEKSYQNSSDWINIGFVANQGNPNSLVYYSFADFSQHKHTVVKYRLKMIDNDGSFQYSNEIEVNVRPKTFFLSQNYPNPFNPVTVISFSLPFSSQVSLKVFDLLGNEITTLVNESKEAGTYQVEFIQNDLASGIYIYRMEAAGYVETKKMMLLR